MRKYIWMLVWSVVLLLFIFLLKGCYNFKYILLLTSFILVCITLHRLLCHKKDIYYILYFPIGFIYFVLFNYIIHQDIFEANPNHYKVIASVTRLAILRSGQTQIYFYYNEGIESHEQFKDVSEDEYNFFKKDGNKIIIVENNRGHLTLDLHPSSVDLYKYSNPVYYINNKEVGNDYYYYAKLCPDIAINNYGLKQVTKAIDNSDTILYYRNLNPSIDSVAHRLADTLQTVSNRTLVGSSFAFLFHDGIYTKEQVFEEIPEAKEYYYKYCKESE